MRYFGTLLMLFFSLYNDINAQKETPVAWTFELKKSTDTDYEIVATAKLNPLWVIYSQFTDDAGPIPTFFTVNGIEVKFEEKSKMIKEFDEMFDVEVMKFKEKAIFTHKIKKVDGKGIKVTVEYMTCDGARCLPPAEVAFDLYY